MAHANAFAVDGSVGPHETAVRARDLESSDGHAVVRAQTARVREAHDERRAIDPVFDRDRAAVRDHLPVCARERPQSEAASDVALAPRMDVVGVSEIERDSEPGIGKFESPELRISELGPIVVRRYTLAFFVCGQLNDAEGQVWRAEHDTPALDQVLEQHTVAFRA